MMAAMDPSDIQLLLFSLLICFLFLYLSKLFLRRNSEIPANLEPIKLPPGNTGWPILGETLEFYSKARQGLHRNFVAERCSKYASSKIFKTSLLGIGRRVAVLPGAEGNKFLFSNGEKAGLIKNWFPLSVNLIFPYSMKTRSNPERLLALRKLNLSVLKGEGLKEYVGVFDDAIKQQLEKTYRDSCSRGEVIKIIEMARKYTLASAFKIFVGMDDPRKIDELEKDIIVVTNGIHSTPINFPGTSLHRAIKASRKLCQALVAIIRQRKKNIIDENNIGDEARDSFSGKDFLSRLLLVQSTDHDQNGQKWADEEMAYFIIGFLVGGYSSVYGTIANTMKYLAEFPQVYNLVLKEQQEIASWKEANEPLRREDVKKMRYSLNVVSEVLRLLTPGPGGFREAITDFQYEGNTIPKGWKIYWSTHATHENPDYFPDPEKFDPSRFEGDGPVPHTFIPFGGGSHMCPGNEYAKFAILVFLHNLVTEFSWEKQVPDEDILHYPFPVPAHGLPVYLHPH